MLNLLSNAIKYTPEGGTVSMSIEVVDPPQNGMTRRLVVEDNGIGMSEAFLARLYEPFAQEHRAEAGKVAGTGLGLTITHLLTQLFAETYANETSRAWERERRAIERRALRRAAAALSGTPGEQLRAARELLVAKVWRRIARDCARPGNIVRNRVGGAS